MITIIKVGNDEHNKDGEEIEFTGWRQLHSEFGDWGNGRCWNEHCTGMCHDLECDCIIECSEHGMELDGWKIKENKK